jgi:hypothetical protein
MSAILRYTLWRKTTLIPERNRPKDAQNEGTNIYRITQHVGLLLNFLYLVGSFPSVIRMIKSRRMRWAGHVARMGTRGMHIGYWWECQKERDHWEDLNVGGGQY